MIRLLLSKDVRELNSVDVDRDRTAQANSEAADFSIAIQMEARIDLKLSEIEENIVAKVMNEFSSKKFDGIIKMPRSIQMSIKNAFSTEAESVWKQECKTLKFGNPKNLLDTVERYLDADKEMDATFVEDFIVDFKEPIRGRCPGFVSFLDSVARVYNEFPDIDDAIFYGEKATETRFNLQSMKYEVGNVDDILTAKRSNF